MKSRFWTESVNVCIIRVQDLFSETDRQVY